MAGFTGEPYSIQLDTVNIIFCYDFPYYGHKPFNVFIYCGINPSYGVSFGIPYSPVYVFF